MIIRSREMEINEETIGKLVGEFNRDVLPRPVSYTHLTLPTKA